MHGSKVAIGLVCAAQSLAGASSTWTSGPYLMLDDTLIAERQGLERRIDPPARWAEPIITGYEDGCFQPYVTVIRDRQSRLFRMWYGVPASPGNSVASRLACIESEDGMHWKRPARLTASPPIQFGASVLDEGPAFADASQRYKFAWWKDGGLRIATSPDGLNWTAISDEPVVRINHDITGIDWDPIRQRYIALLSRYVVEGPYRNLRIPHQSVSSDLRQWKEPWPIVTPDPAAPIEKGETQFYGMSAMLARGNLLVSMVKVLRDDLNCEPGMTAAQLHDPDRKFAGIGYTVLAWSHDGEHWQRDTQPFLDRNAQPGTWDRAMAWADDQIIVGDHTYIYYGGYRWGHKAERFTGRQIGFAQMPRDRYAGFSAGSAAGRLITRPGTLSASAMTINARVCPQDGELRVRVVDVDGQALRGFDWEDGTAIKGDRVDHALRWKRELSTLAGQVVRFELRVSHGTVYSFDLR